MDYTYIPYEQVDDVAFIRMSQADTLNAMTAAMGREPLHAHRAGDLIVAGGGPIFYHAFATLGLASDGVSSHFAIQAVGRVRAMETMLLASKLPALKTLDWGLINRVVWAAADAAFETALSNERVEQREAGRTEEFAEGVRTFRERRPPRFSGRLGGRRQVGRIDHWPAGRSYGRASKR